MLQYEKTPRSGGLIIWGQYQDLSALYDLVMDVSERCQSLDSEGLLSGFAHELRKSWEGQRKETKVQVWDDELTVPKNLLKPTHA